MGLAAGLSGSVMTTLFSSIKGQGDGDITIDDYLRFFGKGVYEIKQILRQSRKSVEEFDVDENTLITKEELANVN